MCTGCLPTHKKSIVAAPGIAINIGSKGANALVSVVMITVLAKKTGLSAFNFHPLNYRLGD